MCGGFTTRRAREYGRGGGFITVYEYVDLLIRDFIQRWFLSYVLSVRPVFPPFVFMGTDRAGWMEWTTRRGASVDFLWVRPARRRRAAGKSHTARGRVYLCSTQTQSSQS